jgi:hypothetical protein
MTRLELVAHWTQTASDFKRLGVLVPGDRVIEELLADLESVLRNEDTQPLTLTEASLLSGYSRDHLSRLVRTGKIPNAGLHHRPRIQRADLPRSANRLRVEADQAIVPIGSKRQIARSVVNSRNEEIHDD